MVFSPKNSDKFLRDFLNHTDDAFLAINLSGEIFRGNAGAQNIFGYIEKEMGAKHFPVLFPDQLASEDAIQNSSSL